MSAGGNFDERNQSWTGPDREPAQTGRHARGAGFTYRRFQSGRLKMGNGCFPNKKILRNSPCLPACKQKNIATRLRDTT